MAYGLLPMAQSSGDFMMYDAYQGMADVGDRVRQLAQNAHAILTAWSSHPYAPPWRRMTAYYELVALAGFTHARPDYEIESVEIDGEAVPVEERGVLWTPFCQLLRFRKEGAEDEPKCFSSRRCPATSPPFCAARSGRCCATTRSSSQTGSTRATSSSRTATSRSRTIPSTSSISCASSARTAISWPFASRPSRRSRRPRSWPGTATASSRRA